MRRQTGQAGDAPSAEGAELGRFAEKRGQHGPADAGDCGEPLGLFRERLAGRDEGGDLATPASTAPRKLRLRMALAAVAIVWAGHIVRDRLGARNLKRKTNGYVAQFCVRVGFDPLEITSPPAMNTLSHPSVGSNETAETKAEQ
jgi:hypothetical protein